MEILKLPDEFDIGTCRHKEFMNKHISECPYCLEKTKGKLMREYEWIYWDCAEHRIPFKERYKELGFIEAFDHTIRFWRYRCDACGAEWRSDLYIPANSSLSFEIPGSKY